MSLRPVLVLLRITVMLQLSLLLAQTALAGGFLGGHYDLLKVHGVVARAIVGVAVVLVVVAVLVRRAGGPPLFIGPSIAALLTLVGQFALGMTRVVAPHVLLGAIMLAVMFHLSIRTFSTPLQAPASASRARDERVEVAP
ncbi:MULTISPECIES: hypothetical protein [Streptomyces]|uniref:Integral membrane protein n=2 Tax=Streptomyces TaxID=1883 RepID=A0ABV9J482_9ACTN